MASMTSGKGTVNRAMGMKAATLAMMLALVVGCSGGENPPGGVVLPTNVPASTDTTAPTVLSTVPADLATGVAVNGTGSVTFSEAIDCSSLNITSVTLTGGGAVASSVTCAAARRHSHLQLHWFQIRNTPPPLLLQ